MALKQKQKEGSVDQPEVGKGNSFLMDASKLWSSMGAEEKQEYQDEANVQKQRYLEYRRQVKEQ